MLDWWGPVIWEYYAATEGGGTTASPEDWLSSGTVGTPGPNSVMKVTTTRQPLAPGTPARSG